MSTQKKRRKMGRGSKPSHRMPRKRRGSIESGGRTSEMESGERV
jgi:hypothetical protein